MTALQLLGYIAAAFAVQCLFVEIDNSRRGPSRVFATNESPGSGDTDGAWKFVEASKMKVGAKKGNSGETLKYFANVIILPDSANVTFAPLF